MPNLQIIKTLAEEKKVTLRKLAEIAGMTEQGLHKAINKDDIKFGSLDRIANFLGVELSIFSDYPKEENETKVSAIPKVITHVGVVGGNSMIGETNMLVSLPEKGKQKIIKPDGTTLIEPISQDEPKEYSQDNLTSDKERGYLDTISLQRQLIDSLQDQVKLLKKGQEES